MSASRRAKATIVGIVLVGIGLLCNPFLITRVLTRDGRFDAGFDPTPVIYGVELLFLAAGSWLAWKRGPRWLVAIGPKLLLVIASVLLSLTVFNLAFPLTMTRLPIRLQRMIPEPFDIIAQSSKEHRVPRDYIAIVGDSYAFGMGDWRMGVNDWSREDWQAAHVLHRRTGIDVVSFGRPGRGSIGSYVTEPLRTRRILRHKYDFADPSLILAYFYEGNDLANNLQELRIRNFPAGPLERRRFWAFLEHTVLVPERYERETSIFLGIRFLARLAQNALADTPKNAIAYWGSDLQETDPGLNLAHVNGRKIPIPLGNQAAPTDLTAEEMDRALEVFEFSFQYMLRQFPHSKVATVYIPGPLSSYETPGNLVIESKNEGRIEATHADVRKRSDEIATRIAAIAKECQADFFDTRPAIRAAAVKELLHGPRDWRHLNRKGYTVLAEEIARRLAEVR